MFSKQSVPNKIKFSRSKYIGGNSSLGRKRGDDLFFTSECIGVGAGIGSKPKHAVILWSNVRTVIVDSPDKSVSGLGGLVRSMSKTIVTVHTKDNEVAYYEITGKDKHDVLAKVTPLLKTVGVPINDLISQQHNPMTNQSTNITEQLKELNELKDEKLITEEEFNAKKKQILGL